MNDNAAKIVGLNRKPYKPPRLASVDDTAEFRRGMVRFWRRGLIGLSIMAVAGHGIVIAALILAGLQGIGETLMALAASCLLIAFASSAFEFFTRKPPTFRHEHYHYQDRQHG